MKHGLQVRRNSFYQTLTGLDYDPASVDDVDLFSKACVEEFRDARWEEYGYRVAQVFEPHVLDEIRRADAPTEHPAKTATRPLDRLIRMAEESDGVSVVKAVNISMALISISRFELAARCVDRSRARASNSRELFELAMLDFIIDNRRHDGAGSPAAFAKMRGAIEAGGIPAERIMDACSQAVVWFLKHKDLSPADYEWFRATGADLAVPQRGLDSAAISSWYRAVAMVPAAAGDRRLTRHYMTQARAAAESTIDRRPYAYEQHLLKTYYESTLKEHMYVTQDLDQAMTAGRALIDLDVGWSVSYGELGDACLKFKEYEEAAALYEKAMTIGPPYVGHHAFQAAGCHGLAGNAERQFQLYLDLHAFDPANRSVVLSAVKCMQSNEGFHDDSISKSFSAIRENLTPSETKWLQPDPR